MKNKPFIKVCGITRKTDLLCAIESGADAIGFIAYPKSPRYLSPSELKALIGSCEHKTFLKIGVFVNASLEEIEEYINAGIDVVQLHGDESEEFALSIKAEVWRAVRLHTESQIEQFKSYPCTKFLIDSFVKDSKIPGGTGHKADWGLASKFVNSASKKVLLAGGISHENLKDAVGEVQPYGLDLSSSIEVSPGIKDHEKIKKLFLAVHSL